MKAVVVWLLKVNRWHYPASHMTIPHSNSIHPASQPARNPPIGSGAHLTDADDDVAYVVNILSKLFR